MALAPTTKATYKQGRSVYVQFCKFVHLECRTDFIVPPDNNIMLLFVSYLAYYRHLTYAGIKPYIYAIRNWAIDQGFKDPTKHHGKKWYKFQSLVAGIKRATCKRKRIRKPLKISTIKKIVACIHGLHWKNCDKLSIKAAILLAFFGFLRSSEYTVTPTNQTSFLRKRDAKIREGAKCGTIKLRLKKSKTDQYNASTVIICGNGLDICPVNAMRSYLNETRIRADSALFWFRNKPLSQRKFNEILKNILKELGMNAKLFSSHSLRSGAASTAACKGVPAWLIQKLGRWSSDCFKIYIPQPTVALRKAQRSMAR